MIERKYRQKKEVKYRGIHMWISRHMPLDLCVNCGKKDVRLHHANISGEYKRDKEDWKVLCVPCHSEFDGNSKIPNSSNSTIVGLREQGISFSEIAKRFDVTRKAISKRYYRVTTITV